MMPDKLPSNYGSSQDNQQMESYGAGNGSFSLDDDESIFPMVPMEAQEPPKDYKAFAEARVYELVSKNGHADEMFVDVSMIDKKNGHGKAKVIVGKDAKRRRFEIPVSIKNGAIIIDRAIDLDTDKIIDIKTNSQLMFNSPSVDVVHKRLQKVYDRHRSFMSGRVTDKKVEALAKRFPSITENEAREFLRIQHDSERSKSLVYSAVDKVEKKHVVMIAGGLLLVALLIVNKVRKRNA